MTATDRQTIAALLREGLPEGWTVDVWDPDPSPYSPALVCFGGGVFVTVWPDGQWIASKRWASLIGPACDTPEALIADVLRAVGEVSA